MSKRVRSKYKINRRLGCNLWGRPKSPWNILPDSMASVVASRRIMVFSLWRSRSSRAITVTLPRSSFAAPIAKQSSAAAIRSNP